VGQTGGFVYQKNARFMWNKEHDIDIKEYQDIGKEIGNLEKVVDSFERNLYGSEYWKAITSYYVEKKGGVGGGSVNGGGNEAFGYSGDESVIVRLNNSFQIELNNQEMEFKRNVVSNWKIPELALSENSSALPPINLKRFNLRESEFS
jgi:hypothetical protein